MRANRQSRGVRGPFLWPLTLAAIGLLLLLYNFLYFREFDLIALWPLLLVLAGVALLFKGDWIPNAAFRTFGITRGSVQTGMLEISAGEIDVSIRALAPDQAERLIAGQFAHNARPELEVDEVDALIRMHRSRTPWLSFADWELAVARNLPWHIALTSYLGRVNLDLRELVIDSVRVGTGFGDIQIILPSECLGEIHLHTQLGTIQISVPEDLAVQVYAHGGRFFNRVVDGQRFNEVEPDVFVSSGFLSDEEPLIIHVYGTFGDLQLI